MNRELDDAIARLDGPAKVSGKAMYAGDQFQPSQLYAAFVTSHIPCGRLETVSSALALAKPAVLRVLTAADMPRVQSALQQVTVPPLASRFVPMQENEIMHEGQHVASCWRRLSKRRRRPPSLFRFATAGPNSPSPIRLFLRS